MFLNLIDSALVAGGDDGHAGNVMALRLAYGQAVDVEASSREKTGYLGENTVFIFYKYRKNTFHLAFSLFCVVVAVDFADHDAGLVAGEETVELCVESLVAVAVAVVHLVGSGDLRIFRIIIELDTERVFLVSLLLMLADETEIVVSHDKDLYRDLVYCDGSKLVHGHLERTVTADNDNLFVRRTHLCSDSGRD